MASNRRRNGANIKYRSGLAAIADRKASASSTMPSHVRGKKKSRLSNAQDIRSTIMMSVE